MIDRARTLRALRAATLLSTFVLAAAGTAAAGDTDHVVTFINKCKQQVWIGEHGNPAIEPHEWALAPTCTKKSEKRVCGPTGTCDDGSCSCTQDSDCAFGAAAGTPTAKCDKNSNKCVRRLKVKMPPGWQGRFWPRTGCAGDATSFVCETGQCGPETGGNIDCNVHDTSGNRATLFEITAAGLGGADSYDVSTVSGYNVPIAVRVSLPDDEPVWQANTSFAAAATIVERIGRDTFAFINTGRFGQSGPTKPDFPTTWGEQVSDGGNVTWANNGPVCERSGCGRHGIDPTLCPSVLQVQGTSGEQVACDAPGNACGGSLTCTTEEKSYLQCVNNAGATDLFGHLIPLMSPNGASPVCFVNAGGFSDCKPGTTCTPVPAWSATGDVGVCTPVIQNGGCEPGHDGQPCPAIEYPYLGYTCQTVDVGDGSTQVCAPPRVSGMGLLWWNADNWIPAPAPSLGPSCTGDADCGAPNKCLMGPVSGGLQQCPGGEAVCECYSPRTCSSSATCSNGTSCLNSAGNDCGPSDVCYCESQAIYGGICGPSNPGWLAAASSITNAAGATWLQSFKDGCPLAYAYQYDDPSSNWDCTNTETGLNDYRVVFCGSAGR